jgi:hypothetical protein
VGSTRCRLLGPSVWVMADSTDHNRRVKRRMPPLGWIAIGLVPGLAAGWWAGGFAACAGDCEVRVQSLEAAGTWVGGIGTILAVLAAVMAYQREEDTRREQNRLIILSREEEQQLAEDEARKVAVTCHVDEYQGDSVNVLKVEVHNQAHETPVYEIRLEYELFSDHPQLLEKLPPLDRHRFGFRWLTGGGPKVTPDEHATWTAQQLEHVTVRFTMNGRRWKRVGSNPVQRDRGAD